MWWYGYHGFPFGGLILTLVLVLLIVRLFMFRRYGWWGCGGRGWYDGRFEAEAILQKRLASGEIDAAEYERLRQVLRH